MEELKDGMVEKHSLPLVLPLIQHLQLKTFSTLFFFHSFFNLSTLPSSRFPILLNPYLLFPPSFVPHSIALGVHILLSINRPDLAQKEYEAARKWADDSLLIQVRGFFLFLTS